MSDTEKIPCMTQAELDELAATLEIQYAVLDNLTDGHSTFRASLTLWNKSSIPLKFSSWEIYFSHVRMIEPGHLPSEDGIDMPGGLQIFHVNGCLFRLKPNHSFLPLNPGEHLVLPFRGQYYCVSRSDIMPNWYILAADLKPQIIASTAGESLSFVLPFDSPSKWKRFDYVMENNKRRFDYYNPLKPDERYERNNIRDLGRLVKLVVPTPVKMQVAKNLPPLSFDFSLWTVRYDAAFIHEAEFLQENTGVSIQDCKTPSNSSNTIFLLKEDVSAFLNPLKTKASEAYRLSVDREKKQIQIASRDPAGMFWGIQTLLSLTWDGYLPIVDIVDAPRYDYRGMHVDVSRNFHGMKTILRLLDVMTLYKLNTLHFHLSDDEGWRLQIPGLEELTEVGSKRGHDLTEKKSLIPMRGSGPDTTSSGTGFYTVEEYRQILRYAADRHIKVVPEIDMPGHSHAAVCSMQACYDRLKAAGDMEGAEQYLLTDLSSDLPAIHSSQMFIDNTLNPGLASTYRFIHKVVSELKAVHKDVNPLTVFHLGGDEVSYDVWEQSPACKALVDKGEIKSHKDLMQYFVVQVAKIAEEHELAIGIWQDGIVHKHCLPFPRSCFPNKKVVSYAWRNDWETGSAFDTYKVANAGYEVILAPGTHMYFDHPQEPDPEERGAVWACRFSDTRKVFAFAPDNLFSNAEVRLTGEQISKEDLNSLMEDEAFEPLNKPENIIGLQGQLWTELVRTGEQFDSMICPRLLALAERAWHEAKWESGDRDSEVRRMDQQEDWTDFANTLGYKELKRLDRLKLAYYLPPPGAKITEKYLLEANCQIPGLLIQFSTDGGRHWRDYSGSVEINNCEIIFLRTCSVDGTRHSRCVELSAKQ